MKFGTMTQIGLYRGQTVKISIFFKIKMAAAAILKITKIAISPQLLNQFLVNFVRSCKIGLLTAATVKKFEFHKSKMAANLKNR